MMPVNFTKEQISAQSMSNLTSYIILTIAYLKQNNLSVEDWLNFIGQKFLDTWVTIQTPSLKEIAKGVILNNLSGGSKLVSFSEEESKIKIILEPSLPKKEAEFYGVSWEDSQLVHDVLNPVFQYLKVKYKWEILDNKRVIIELSY